MKNKKRFIWMLVVVFNFFACMSAKSEITAADRDALEQLAKNKEGFTTPFEKELIVMPLVDAKGKTFPMGTLVSEIATHKSVYARTRDVICFDWLDFMHTFYYFNWYHPEGTFVSDSERNTLLGRCHTDLYADGSLIFKDKSWTAKIVIHNGVDDPVEKNFKGSLDELPNLPGDIAKWIFKYRNFKEDDRSNYINNARDFMTYADMRRAAKLCYFPWTGLDTITETWNALLQFMRCTGNVQRIRKAIQKMN